MSKRRLIIVPFVIFLMAVFAGCESAELTALPSPSPTIASSANPINTPDSAPSNVPTPTFPAILIGPSTFESAPPSDYEVFCSELPLFDDFEQFSDGDSMTYGQAAAGMSAVIAAWEASDPPAEIAAWHNERMTAWQSFKAVFDAQPGDTLVDGEDEALGLASIRWLVNVVHAEGLLPRETRNALVSAGCLGDDVTPDNHGDEPSTATTIALGDEIEGMLDSLTDTDYFVFTAEAGTSYQVGLLGNFGWILFLAILSSATEVGDPIFEERDFYKPSRIVLYDPSGMELQSAEFVPISFIPDIITWEADAAGDYYISYISEGDWRFVGFTPSFLNVNGDAPTSNDDYAGAFVSQITWLAPASGDYFIEVPGWWGGGTYTLTVTEVP